MAQTPPALVLYNRLVPRPPGVEQLALGETYGPLARHRLDVYRPRRRARPAPLLVFIHGGGWDSGERAAYAFAGRAFAARGFTTVLPDYRLTDEAPFPAFLEDCSRAVAHALRRAKDWGAPAGSVLLAGHSAGAYNAAMLALDRRWLAQAGAQGRVLAWAGLSGPYDFLPLEAGPGLRTFGEVADLPATQPIAYVRAGSPPAFLGHGGRDRTVYPRNSHRLAERMRALGVPVETRDYPKAGHADLVLALAAPLSLRLPVIRDAARFLHAAFDAQAG